ncbi:hypothetical protein L7F22_063914 [Adiantum nelumboides]|nr:hypothetical protein [Adiantum nelumboides]
MAVWFAHMASGLPANEGQNLCAHPFFMMLMSVLQGGPIRQSHSGIEPDPSTGYIHVGGEYTTIKSPPQRGDHAHIVHGGCPSLHTVTHTFTQESFYFETFSCCTHKQNARVRAHTHTHTCTCTSYVQIKQAQEKNPKKIVDCNHWSSFL